MKRLTEERAKVMIEYLDSVIKESEFPLDDKKTYELISKGDTDGIFMMETDWDKYDLRQIKPQNMEELIVAVTLSHGCDLNPYIYTYIKRSFIQPYTKPIYTHIPEIDKILNETHGIVLYNEQRDEINNIIDSMSDADKKKYHIAIAILRDEMSSHHTTKRPFFAKRALLCYKLAYMKANMLDEFKQLINEINK